MKKKVKSCINIFLFVFVCTYLILTQDPALCQDLGCSSNAKMFLTALLIGVLGTLVLLAFASLFFHVIKQFTFTKLFLTASCLLAGAFGGFFLGSPFSNLPGRLGTYAPVVVTVFCCLSCALIIQQKYAEFSAFVNRMTNGKFQISEVSARNDAMVLLDTSVIIDGRIADIAATGFIPGTMVIPTFILQELQYIADSEDSQRRQRGRRGLDILAELQKNKSIKVSIEEFDIQNVREVDGKLVVLAQQLNCPIVTNDYNLNKVADLQGVRILNVNDLTNAVKSILLPGEHLHIDVIQDGKEQNQGVGYLEDGTMVVVENGRSFMGKSIDVTVTKILQTAAGRMIFARHEYDFGVKR